MSIIRPIWIDSSALPADNSILKLESGATGKAVAGSAGGALARGSAVIQGHTTPESPATSPPQLVFTFQESGAAMEGSLTFNFNGTSHVVYFSATDPTASYPNFWVDTTSISDNAGMATGMATAISASIGNVTVTDMANGGGVSFDNSSTGAAAVSTKTGQYGIYGSETGGGSGTDIVPASGSVVEAQLIALSAGKTTKAVRLGFCGEGVAALIQMALKTAGGTYSDLGTVSSAATLGEIEITASTLSVWLNGVSEGHIIARMVDGGGSNIATEDIPEGGSLTLWAIAEQI